MAAAGQKPQRTCLGCRAALRRDALVRYAATPDGKVTVDYRQRLPGRGAYTCVDRACLEQAVKRRQFPRALRAETLQYDFDRLLGELLAQMRGRIVNLLGMARKSGQVVSGSSLVLDQLSGREPPALVLAADDMSQAIAERVAGKAQATAVAFYRMFDKELLGQVLGKGERSVVAVRRGALAEAIENELERFKRIAGES